MVFDRSQKERPHRRQRNFRTLCPLRSGWLPLETILPSPCWPYSSHFGFGHASWLRSYRGFRPRFPILITPFPGTRIWKIKPFVNY
jgi:hypothetical protein